MMISTRGRYALRVMIDLAEQDANVYTPMKDVALRQDISLKYLEKILPVLRKKRLIEGIHGKGGGYRLTRQPEDYPVGEILKLAEGGLEPVACLRCEAEPCVRTAECKTLPLWQHLDQLIMDYLNSVTLADLVQGKELN